MEILICPDTLTFLILGDPTYKRFEGGPTLRVTQTSGVDNHLSGCDGNDSFHQQVKSYKITKS